jgi:hypothetical protein
LLKAKPERAPIGASVDYIINQNAVKADKGTAFELTIVSLVKPVKVAENLLVGQILFFTH